MQIIFKYVKTFFRFFSIEIFNYNKLNPNKIEEINILKKKQSFLINFLNSFIKFLNKDFFLLEVDPVKAENLQYYIYNSRPKKIKYFKKNFNHDAVAVCGFGASGSSLILDYLSQYNSFIDPKPKEHPFEFRFIKDPGGLLDLRDNILRSNYYWNNYAYVQDFLNQVSISSRPYRKNIITKLLWNYDAGSLIGFSFNKITNNNFNKISKSFINDLYEVKFNYKWWNSYRNINFFFQILNNIKNLFYKKNESLLVLNKNLSSNSLNEKFKKYLKDVFFEMINYNLNSFSWFNTELNKIEKFTLLLDQGASPSSAKKTLEILPKNSKIIIVYRDPRDVYLSTAGFFPKDPESFCKIFESEVNKALDQKHENILHVQFEDFVMNSKIETDKLCKFLNIDKSNNVLDERKILRTRYNLKWSKSRIRKWEKIENRKKEIEYISKRLSHLCYNKNV